MLATVGSCRFWTDLSLGTGYLCLKNCTWRSRFNASSRVLYGPPNFLPVFLESSTYPFAVFRIMCGVMLPRTFMTPGNATSSSRRSSNRLLPLFLDSRGELLDPAKERCHLP